MKDLIQVIMKSFKDSPACSDIEKLSDPDRIIGYTENGRFLLVWPATGHLELEFVDQRKFNDDLVRLISSVTKIAPYRSYQHARGNALERYVVQWFLENFQGELPKNKSMEVGLPN